VTIFIVSSHQGRDQHRADRLNRGKQTHPVVLRQGKDQALNRADADQKGKKPMSVASDHQPDKQEPEEQRTDHGDGK